MQKLNKYIQEKLIINSKAKLHLYDDNYVDLDLPSGLLWNKYNYGVDDDEKYGIQCSYSKAISIVFDDESRLPTKEDFDELYKYCKYTFIKSNNKLDGIKFTSLKNNKSIFLPVCKKENIGYGYYWSSTERDNFNAYSLWFSDKKILPLNFNNKNNKFYIRQVLN